MTSARNTVQQYSENTTVHGISYVFEKGLPHLERLLWILAVVTGIGLAIYMSLTAYWQWVDNPVLTTIGTTGYPIENVSFPAITICSQVEELEHSS